MTRFEIALNKPVKESIFSVFNIDTRYKIRFLPEKEPISIFKYRHFDSFEMTSHCPVCDSQKKK
jgi:hypothetical protein